MELGYDDRKLQQLFAELEPRRRTQALKGAFRKEANHVRKTAVRNLRTSGIHSDRDMEKGIRPLVFKRKTGFRVTIGTKRADKNGRGERGYHTNRKGLKKPVLLWAEAGTKARYRESKSTKMSRLRGSRKGYTGRMQTYGFMSKTLADVKGGVTDELHREVRNNIVRIAEKYGCR